MQKIATFIKQATCSFLAVEAVEKQLVQAGYERLWEKEEWEIEGGKQYFVVRNDSSLIAFDIPKQELLDITGALMICAHSDSPCFKIKENPIIKAGTSYCKINVERYGGMIEESWFDRPLSIAGRVVLSGKEMVCMNIDFKRPVCMIPSLAIHMRRGQEGDKINAQNHLLPLVSILGNEFDFMQVLADEINRELENGADKWCEKLGTQKIEKDAILGMDLYTYVCQKAELVGMNQELFVAPRLDDLLCVFSGTEALLESQAKEKIHLLGIFDNEEVGSKTMQGADSDFLQAVLKRVICSLSKNQVGQSYERILAGSFLLSADNAHALHPNYGEKADPTNQPVLGQGIVLKYHAGQKYTTSGLSGAQIKKLCEENQLSLQTYHNRSDLPGGSTLGNLALSHVSVMAADVGVAQLAMHSACECAAVKDIADMGLLMKAFYCQA